jgi:sulfur-oxidizing protein SoxY
MTNIKIVLSLIFILLLSPNATQTSTHFSWEEWIKEVVFGDEEIQDGSDFIFIEAPYRALNGANVPIKIYTKSPGIVKYTLIVDENPTPCCAIFEFDNMLAYVETNIRVNAYGYLRVIAEDNYGNKFMTTKFIKAAGGCSAPSVLKTDKAKGSIEVKEPLIKPGITRFQIWHPNYSGMQFDQLTRAEIPAEYIDEVDIHFDDSSFHYEGTIGIAENVYFGLASNTDGNVIASDNLDNNFLYFNKIEREIYE